MPSFFGGLGFVRDSNFSMGVQASNLTIVRVTAADDENALALMRQYDDKDFSLTDATAFVIMQRLGIRYGFTFDRHFTQYGVETLSA
jgi:predicted nucleic acid-binding protein